jgi:glyoxylase-like metal-dependent hydrolase (beta-lactamase superfamily II)/rhodanese-related sulfurtransferase
MRIDLGEGAWTEQISTPSLGDHTYLVVAGGAAAVIDPQRDVDRFVARIPGIPLAAVLETHVHNDYVTGGPALAAASGAEYVLPTGSGADLPHRAVADGEAVTLGEGWALRAVHTPGHTPHHTTYVLDGPDGPTAAFTGGSMLVGAVGRTDLVDPALTEALTRDQHRSVRRLAAGLADPVAVAPTHGSGSFCTASATGETTSTVGAERLHNPALLIDDEDHFVSVQIAGFLLHPTYYAHMAPINRSGAPAITAEDLPRIDPDDPGASNAVVVDLRPADEFAGAHVPGSLNIPLDDSTATYAGWVLEWNTPMLLVGRDGGEIREARLQLARIGYDRVIGAIDDGLEDWKAAGKPLSAFRVARWDDLRREEPEVLLDVRDPKEAVHRLPGAIPVHVSSVDPAAVPEGEVWVHCVTGYRAAIAASQLHAAGRSTVLVLDDLDRYQGPRVPV